MNETTRVHGRRISYEFYDAYNPALTVQLTRRLVEQDKVFAVFNTVGTANSLAVREYLNAQKVPQLFAADGSQAIGNSPARYPWTMGFLEFTGSDVTSQVPKLKRSGADTLMLFATPKFFIQAVVSAHKLAWKPRLYIASVSIEPGIMAIARVNAPELTRGALSIAFV